MAAITLLETVEAHQQRMALVLLAGTVLLTGGQGLGTSALIAGAPLAVDASRFLVAAGLWLLAAAVLTDKEAGAAAEDSAGVRGSAELGQLLRTLAMVAAVTVTGALVLSSRPGAVCVVGLVLSVALAAGHRWISARDEARMAARLTRSEAYFRSLVRSSGDAVIILDDALRLTWASVALGRALGQAADDLVGRPLLDAVRPGDVAGWRPPSPAATRPRPRRRGPACCSCGWPTRTASTSTSRRGFPTCCANMPTSAPWSCTAAT